MKSDKLGLVDLLADESFINYCKRSSPQDVAYWENYMTLNPDRRELLESAKENFIQLFNALSEADLEEQVIGLRRKMDLLDTTKPVPVIQIDGIQRAGTRPILPKILKLTAAAVLLISILFTINYYNNGRNKGVRIFQSAYGERKNIQLPDGSEVTLNAGSKIEIKENFGISTRDVYLEGEAFFDIKHSGKVPFIVHTVAMDVKALGTAFNVKAYRNEKVTEASLIRGLVEVTLKESNNQRMLLYPNHKIKWDHSFAKSDGNSPGAIANQDQPGVADSLVRKLEVTDYGDIRELAWKENKLMFEDELFSDIAILLERWYGVKVELKDDTIRNYRFTGIFEKEDINTVLEFLKESKKFNYRIENGETIRVILSK
ncbi:MAG TPA: DUF4974 domain-containing protein [Chitinophagaceae bacterium]|nr:DUF4974 domain-containing protein [Chitinophagaceae bacterium]